MIQRQGGRAVSGTGNAPALRDESPFIEVTLQGPEGLSTKAQVEQSVAIFERVRPTAAAG
jgi:hypothetical protein